MINIKDEFILLLDIVKMLNSEYVLLHDNEIFSLDINMNSNFKYCDINPLNMLSSVFASNDIKELEKIMKITKEDVFLWYDRGNPCIQCSDAKIYPITRVQHYVNRYRENVRTIRQIKKNKEVYEDTDIKSNKVFSAMLDNKVTDGASILVVDKYFMTIFKGLIKVNKSDKVLLKIYEVDNESFLSEFIVNKKKYNIINNIRFRY